MHKRELIIYGLLDPNTDELRYVGKSSSGMERPQNHFQAAVLKKESGTHKANWILKLVSNGQLPKVVTLYNADTLEELDQAEREFIRLFRAWGCRLTNVKPGGEGGPQSENTREKISQGHRRRQLHLEDQARRLSATGVSDSDISDRLRMNRYRVSKLLGRPRRWGGPARKLNPADCQQLAILYAGGKSLEEIAEAFNVCTSTIYLALRRIEGVRLRRISLSSLDHNEICQIYLTGSSAGQIGQKFNVSTPSILKILRSRGVQIRKSGRPRKSTIRE